jgi:hypothetical protein
VRPHKDDYTRSASSEKTLALGSSVKQANLPHVS